MIACTLMVLWSKNLPAVFPRFQFLDLFAGVANATKIWWLDLPFLEWVLFCSKLHLGKASLKRVHKVKVISAKV